MRKEIMQQCPISTATVTDPGPQYLNLSDVAGTQDSLTSEIHKI